MSLLPVGILVFVFLAVVGGRLGSVALIGLLASLPFGSTSFAALTAIGGATPLIYCLFVIVLVLASLWHGGVAGTFFAVLQRHRHAWVVLLLAAYAMLSAYLLPRLFAGMTSAFVIVNGAPTEMPLAPNSLNVTQTAYFLLGVLVFFATSANLAGGVSLATLDRGFLAMCVVHVCLGLLDLGGKIAGLGDVLLPIRTANYALLTEVQEGGFWRIVGGYPEASSYAMGTLTCLAYTVTRWRHSGSSLAMMLSVVLLFLLAASTSTTAYVGGALVAMPLGMSLLAGPLRGRVRTCDLAIGGFALVAAFVCLLVFAINARIFDPVIDLFTRLVLEKASSGSGQERAYWNLKSLQGLVDTYGIGIGMGSSRSSSWAISVISQLGVLGAVLMFPLAGLLASGLRERNRAGLPPLEAAIVASVCSCVLANLVALVISSGSADPGIYFFLGLAVVIHARALSRQGQSGFFRPPASYGTEGAAHSLSYPARLHKA